MPFLTPDVYFPHITDIPGNFFKERGIRLMILDVDNTLTSHNNPTPFPGIPEWIEERKGEGLTPVILSNNTPERVAPFAELIGLPFVAGAAKPLTFGITRALKRYGMRAEETCLIGDQLFHLSNAEEVLMDFTNQFHRHRGAVECVPCLEEVYVDRTLVRDNLFQKLR